MNRIVISFLVISFFNLCRSNAQSVSVDPSSGRAIVQIPLYTLNYGSTSVPINLSHTQSAMGVKESGGDAGVGWDLTCNYAVYREVKGLPDDAEYGWLSGTTASSVNNFVSSSNDNFSSADYSDETNDYNFINGFRYSNGLPRYIDSEPDVFIVSGPGVNFQFVFDANQIPRLLDYQDVKITYTLNVGGISGFTIKNNKGITYSFTKAETVLRKAVSYKSANVDMFLTDYNNNQVGTEFNSKWLLTSVIDEVGKTVSFNYITREKDTSSDLKIRKIGDSAPADTLYFLSDSYTPHVLNNITAGGYTVNFSYGADRTLYSIKVTESGQNDFLQYNFGYRQLADNRSLLTQILPFTANCNAYVPYKFIYEGISQSDVPLLVRNFGQDMWGYYNGYSGARPLQGAPQMYFYSAQTDGRRFTLQPIPNNTATTILTGANRNVQASKIGIGALTQITFPTGGYTKIVWERNKYLDSLSGQVLFGPGQRVAKLITDGGEAAFARNASDKNQYHQIIKTYTYQKSDTDTTTSGLITSPASYGFATGGRLVRTPYALGQGGAVTYRRVKETTTQGSTVYVYNYPAAYPAVSYSNDWVATKSKIARNPATHYVLTNVQNGYYTYPFAPNPNYGFAQGRLASVSEYSTSGVLVRQKRYGYARIAPASQTVYGLKYEYLGINDCDCFHFAKYAITTGVTNVLTKQIVTEVSESNPSQLDNVTTYFHYNNDAVNGNFLMDSVRTVWGDGTVDRKKIRYIKDYASLTNPTVGDVMANAIVAMVNANQHGEVVEQVSTFQPRGGVAAVSGAGLQLYQVMGGKVFPYKTLALPQGKTFTPASITSGTTQGFSFGTDYVETSVVSEVDAVGNIVSLSDNRKNKGSSHFALNYQLAPVATFANANASETIYEGFEFATGRNFTPTTALTYDVGWTGQRSAVFGTGNTLTSAVINNVGKPYRISCYVKAAQNSTLTFQLVNASTNAQVTSSTLNYTTPNQWVYLEGVLNVTLSTPVTLKALVTTNANVSIDDIIVMPQAATVSTRTFQPLRGQTSETDDRGYSNTITFDQLGRKTGQYDRQRNLVELTEYQTKGRPIVFWGSMFNYTTPMSGLPFTATAANVIGNCFNDLTYEWRIDGAVVGTNSPTLTTTVATSGSHVLKLTTGRVTTQETYSYEQKITVLPNSTPPAFSFTSLPAGNTICNTQPFDFTISTPTLGCGGYIPTYYTEWFVLPDGASTYVRLTSNSNNATNTSVHYKGSAPGYRIKAVVNQTCYNNDPLDPASFTTSTAVEQDITVTVCNGN